ncbi:MAG TPA: hypothetical protein DDX59_01180 [Lachnospiraceae bacterium]|nr:hypothetical protein [Lachnospiraceae bacterium]
MRMSASSRTKESKQSVESSFDIKDGRFKTVQDIMYHLACMRCGGSRKSDCRRNNDITEDPASS